MLIEKMLVGSTGNLTEDTCNRYLPDNEPSNGWYEKRAYGWFIRVSADLGSHPPDLEEVLNYAREAGCGWVMLDRDYEPIPSLPFYDW